MAEERKKVDEDLIEDLPPPDGLDVYQPKERFIFKYFNGEKMTVADPLVLYRRVMAKINEIDIDMKAAAFPGFEKADEAYDSAIANLRKIFKIKPLEEGGLTPTELEELFNQFSDYCQYHKKKWSLTPISQTETSDSTDSSSAGNLPTENISVISLTPHGQLTEKPTSSPSAQGSPTDELTQGWSIGGM